MFYRKLSPCLRATRHTTALSAATTATLRLPSLRDGRDHLRDATLTLRLGCSTCSNTPLYCRNAWNAPVLLFSRCDRYSPATTRYIRRIWDIVPSLLKPDTLSLAHGHLFPLPHTRALLLSSHVARWFQGAKRPCLRFAYPPFLLSGCPESFLGKSRLLPLPGFRATTTP